MNEYSAKRGFPAGNPIANALVIIVGALVIGASLVLGFVAFVILSAVLLVLAAVVGIRLWWFNRKLKRSGATASIYGTERRGPDGFIEGEYHVVVEERERPSEKPPE
ncbi:MAG: hypothetical protein QNJ00_18110 [Woeseiaceae bacterium]|nr:hypothetical protein [Woeseiaceae bacterium]